MQKKKGFFLYHLSLLLIILLIYIYVKRFFCYFIDYQYINKNR